MSKRVNSQLKPGAGVKCSCRWHRRAHLVKSPPRISVDGTVPFVPGWALRVPHEPGVYLVHDLRGPLYVGLTEDLNQRFHQHYWDSHNRLLSQALAHPCGEIRFSWILTKPREQAQLERELIRALQPLCNDLMYTHDS